MILALETSTEQSSIALLDKDTLLFDLSIHHGRDLTRLLVPAIEQAFALLSRDLREVTGIAVAVGPGSFTGLRIGVTTAKTLAFALSVPVAPVSTLAALARAPQVAGGQWVAAVLDARREECFCAWFRKTPAGLDRLEPDHLLPVRELAERLPLTLSDPFSEAGGSLPLVIGPRGTLELLARKLPPEIYRVVEAFPAAREVARIGRLALERGEGIDPFDLVPIYLRRSYAEEKADLPS